MIPSSNGYPKDRLDRSKAILAIASQMGISSESPARGIVEACKLQVSQWIEGNKISTFAKLEEIVCAKLHLTFEIIRIDNDIERLVEKYASKGEIAFAYIRNCFDEHTYGTLFKRRNARKNASDKYVAFIDCRGDKGARCYFSKWHEIAHVMTNFDQMEIPFHRSTVNFRDETELLMDRIAGEIGFFDELFCPVMNDELRNEQRLTFGAVDKIQSRVCDDASFHSTLIACCQRVDKPTVYLEAKLAYKKSEKQLLNSGQSDFLEASFPESIPKPKLRATIVKPNLQAIEAGIEIHQNMEIPESSAIYRLHNSHLDELVDVKAVENLSTWTHSDGSALKASEVVIEARKYKDSLYAVITPA